MPEGHGHLFENNTFRHIYCSQGCVYSSIGSKVQKMVYQGNVYQYLVAKEKGTIFYDEDITLERQVAKPWLQIFKNEYAAFIFGSAIDH